MAGDKLAGAEKKRDRARVGADDRSYLLGVPACLGAAGAVRSKVVGARFGWPEPDAGPEYRKGEQAGLACPLVFTTPGMRARWQGKGPKSGPPGGYSQWIHPLATVRSRDTLRDGLEV